MRYLAPFIFSFFFFTQAFSQAITQKQAVVQFSGVVVTEEQGEIVFLPYTNVAVKGTSRGTITESDGFFSIVAVKGETIVFSRIGYENANLVIPDTLTADYYSIVQPLTKDTILLPEAVIYPWPSREHFKIEFLAMDITDELRQQAEENLDAITMAELRENLPVDGREATSMVLKENADKAYYYGQLKPQNILNPLAWKKFIDSWKRGDFKKKDKDKK